MGFSFGGFSRCGAQAFEHTGFSSYSTWALYLRFPGSMSTGSTVEVHGLRNSVACGIFQDQGSNPRLLHWQVDSLPLSHQGSPQAHYISCALYYYDISLTSDHQALDPSKWDPCYRRYFVSEMGTSGCIILFTFL